MTRPAVLNLSPGPLQDAVLRRVTGAVALQSGLSPEEMDALAVVAQALATGATAAGCAALLRVELHPGNGTVAVGLGPLGAGQGRAAIAAAGDRPDSALTHARLERAGPDDDVRPMAGQPAT